jgi:hypothetical protein
MWLGPGLHPFDFGPASGVMTLVVGGFTLWMLIECLRKDTDRFLWGWVILVVPLVGPLLYFVMRWMPGRRMPLPPWIMALGRGRELRRLESAALQIGNPYQHVQLGEALRETGRFEEAHSAYARALEKEPNNLQALWGAAQVDLHFKQYDCARERLEKVLHADPQYKFGDVSLAYARTLLSLQQTDDAAAHLEKHVKRWRHPEGIYLLASLYAHGGRLDEARTHLRAMLAEIESSPAPIARKQGAWRRRGRQLLRSLGA